MKPRFTTWLLAALMAVAAAFCVPPSCVAPLGAPYCIVGVDKARQPQRKISERREAAASPQPQNPIAVCDDEFPLPSRILDQSLFQRPPPVSSSSHA